MSTILALIYVFTCILLLYVMYARPSAITAQMGVVAVFSIAYYPLPVLFRSMSDLASVDDLSIFYALLLHYLFLLCVCGGVCLGQAYLSRSIRPAQFGGMDQFFSRNRHIFSILAFAVYVGAVLSAPQTSYAVEDVRSYFEEKSAVNSIFAAASGVSLAFICGSYALTIVERRRAWIYGVAIAIAVLLAVPLGQRLALITPIVTLFASLSAARKLREATRILVVAIVVLSVMSPFAVYLREARRAANGDFLSASEVIGDYSLSNNPIMKSFQSLLDRSDLVYNTIFMKQYIDDKGPVGLQYYYSVLVSPIPRLLYPSKPVVLSSTGTLDGEISVLAWRVIVGGLGSLTAFGGLTAYREGQWLGIVLDGLAAGLFFSAISRWLADGGFIGRIFYANFFVLFSVQKVPPCFFEALTSVLGQMPILMFVYIVSKIFVRPVHRTEPVARRRSIATE